MKLRDYCGLNICHINNHTSSCWHVGKWERRGAGCVNTPLNKPSPYRIRALFWIGLNITMCHIRVDISPNRTFWGTLESKVPLSLPLICELVNNARNNNKNPRVFSEEPRCAAPRAHSPRALSLERWENKQRDDTVCVCVLFSSVLEKKRERTSWVAAAALSNWGAADETFHWSP